MAYTRQQVPFAAGSETSFEAALHASKFVRAQGMHVYHWLKSRGASGGTQKEAAAALRISRQSLTGRFKALEDAKAIRRGRPIQKREGCEPYVVCGRMRGQLSLWERA